MFRYHTIIRIIFFLLLTTCLIWAEDTEEEIFSVEGETSEANELIELMQQFKREPLLINSASKEDLQQLLWLSSSDIRKILKVRKNQVIASSEDLVEAGLDLLTINAILPYISFKQKIDISLFQQTRGEYKKVKDEMSSTLRYYQKTLMKIGKLQAGFVSQKDEGETDPLDFYSVFLNYKNEGFVQQVLIGHYRVGLGQGILFAPKLGMSKSSASTTIPIKRMKVLKPYTSSYEIWDLRGIGTTLQYKNVNLTPFYSNNDLSANISEGKVTSFDQSGIHLETPELVKEEIFGVNIDGDFNDINLGLTASRICFDVAFADDAMESEYDAFSFYGKVNKLFQPMFWEVATASNKFAGVGGVAWGDNKIRHLFLVRYYEKDFPTWHGKPFSAQSNFDNEMGCYFGSTIKLVNNLKINLYFDVWKYPETRYFEKLPTAGSEEFLQIELKRKPHNLRFILRHKSVDKQSSLNGESKIRYLERTVLRLDWWQKLKMIRFKTRLEFAKEDLDERINSGWLCYEELKFQQQKWRVIFNYTVYNSQVLHYMYENGVDGVMQNRILSGDGSYAYVLVEYDFSKKFTIQSKVGGNPDNNNSLAVFLQIISHF